MPNTASAAKRVRQTAKRRALNRWRKERIKVDTKALLQAIHDQDITKADAEFRKLCGVLDRVACTSAMHRNTAARRKSRLARRVQALRLAKGTSGR